MPLFFIALCISFLLSNDASQSSLQNISNSIKIEDGNPKFAPAKVNSPYYASFGVNLTYSNFFHSKFFNVHSFNSITFALDMGGVLGEQKNILLGFYLDGAAGGGRSNALYGGFSGIKIGGRLLEGRLIPFLKLGMSITHFPFEIQNRQFNTYGLDAEIGAFIDIGQGYGINLSYRYGYNNAYQLKLKNIHTSILMLGFRYYDFSLDW